MSKFIRRKFNHEDHPSPRKKLWEGLKIDHVSLNVIFISLIILSGFLYLFAINQSATSGFEIKGLQARIEQLKQDNKKLQLYTAELQSLNRIEMESQNLNMIAVSKYEYLPAVGSVIAVK